MNALNAVAMANVVKLQTTFQHIRETRMAGIELLNPNLRVETVEFRSTQYGCLGVLITPWFVNLVLLPEGSDAFDPLPAGTRRYYDFPAGQLQFIGNVEEGLGEYQSCSLISPPKDFRSQQMAVDAAAAAILTLFNPPKAEEPKAEDESGKDGPDASKRGFLRRVIPIKAT